MLQSLHTLFIFKYTDMETLGKLFGTVEKVKIIRLFLFNHESFFDAQEIATRIQSNAERVMEEMTVLTKIGLVKKKSVVREVEIKKGRKVFLKKANVPAWSLNTSFVYLAQLQNFLIDLSPIKNSELLKRIGKVGKLKLVIVSGIFIRDWESRLDLLVVGDGIKKGAMERAMKSLEAEVGKEIRYSTFETSDFKYRLGMYDKLIRDVLDFKHTVVMDKLALNK